MWLPRQAVWMMRPVGPVVPRAWRRSPIGRGWTASKAGRDGGCESAPTIGYLSPMAFERIAAAS
jgi:hypothetical protein